MKREVFLITLKMRMVLYLVICIVGTNIANAQIYDFKVVNEGNTIYYIVRGTSATVVKGEEKYSDNVIIPATVSNEGTDYSVIAIGDFAFSDCGDLISITLPPTLLSIGKYAFAHCSSLKSIDIPNSVMSIGSWTFWNCTNLTSVNLSSSLKAIESNLFQDCGNLTSLDIPSSVRRIGDMAFQGCKRLSKVSIPNSVISIGKFAFQECRSLESLTIPNQLTTIEQYTFSKCSRLLTLTIPSSVSFIDEWAFWDCSGLKTVTIPNSVSYIGDWAFTSCDAIETVYSEIENPFPIGQYVFERGVKAIANLYVPAGTKESYQNASGWDFTKIIEEEPALYNLVIWAKDGTKIAEYSLNTKPKVTFTDYSYVVSSEGAEIESYDLERLARFTYEKTDATGINSFLIDETSFSMNDETLIFPSLKANSFISVYALNGTLAFSKRISQAGQYSFPISNLTSGIYIIRVNGSTYKIIKK